MLPAEERVSDIPPLIDQKAYFVIHAPRQMGKTTSLLSLAVSLSSKGHYCPASEVRQQIRMSFTHRWLRYSSSN